MGSTPRKPEAQAIAEICDAHLEAKLLEIGAITHPDGSEETVSALVVPMGAGRLEVRSLKVLLDEYKSVPDYRQGRAVFTELASFVAHANRFKDVDSAIFADVDAGALKASLTSVLDYHKAGFEGLPRHGRHRGHYEFPFSDEWRTWAKLAGKQLDQVAFAQLLEDRIADVADPATAGEPAKALAMQLGVSFGSPSGLLTLSRGCEIHAQHKVAQHTRLDSGVSSFSFEETHASKDGGPVKVPGAFLLGIPVFRGGALYQIPVRLRYKLQNGQVTWSVDLYRTDRAFAHALGEALAKVQTDTGLPLFQGSPE